MSNIDKVKGSIGLANSMAFFCAFLIIEYFFSRLGLNTLLVTKLGYLSYLLVKFVSLYSLFRILYKFFHWLYAKKE